MRKEFMERIDARGDVARFPFGADEMLLQMELKDLDKKVDKTNEGRTKDLASFPFGAEEMLLKAEIDRGEI